MSLFNPATLGWIFKEILPKILGSIGTKKKDRKRKEKEDARESAN